MKKLDERITSIEQIDDEFAGKTIDEILDELLGPEESEDDFGEVEDDFQDEFDFDAPFADDSESTVDDEFLEIEDEETPFDLDAEQEEDFDNVNLDDFSDVFPEELDSKNDDESLSDDMEFDPAPIDSPDQFEPSDTTEQEENPNYQGILRTVMGANLVYKRQTEDGTFEELWIYNVGDDVKQEIKIRKAILAGTDILPGNVTSQDGSQELDTYTVGNVQYLKITGLPN